MDEGFAQFLSITFPDVAPSSELGRHLKLVFLAGAVTCLNKTAERHESVEETVKFMADLYRVCREHGTLLKG
jgi:hypothetical protein